MLVFSLSVAFESRGQNRVWEEFGDAAGDQLGWVVAGAGDVDGDGYADVIAGEYRHNSITGRARVYSGTSGSSLMTFDGIASGDSFGYSVAGPGDVDGDGTPDVAVGAWLGGGSNSGYVRVFSGLNGAPLYTINGQAYNFLGAAHDRVSDIDGDGIGDLLIGANGGTSNGGFVLVASGASGSTIRTLRGTGNTTEFGQVVAHAGDVDGDGIEDMIVGDPLYSGNAIDGGAAWVFSGADGSVLYMLFGTDCQELGTSVGTAGDVNADGYSDLIVGAPYDSTLSPDNGLAVVYSGKDGTVLYSILGDLVPYGTLGWQLGYAVSSAGDQNSDGYADFLVGAPNYWDVGSLFGGAAFLYSGRDGEFLYHYAGTGAGNLSNSGYGVALGPVGDINGDGVIDVTITDPANDTPTLKDAGSVSVCLGSEIFLDATPKKASAGLTVTFTVAQGVAGGPAAMVLVSVNGAPTFVPFELSLLDPTGRQQIQGVVPAGLGSLTLGLKAYTLNAGGKLIESGAEFLTLE
jgi:hypothetical protein